MIDCASLTDEIEQTDQLMRERKELFHRMWEEEQQRITIEQTIFKEQVNTVKSRAVDRSTIQFLIFFWPKVTVHKHQISPS